MHWTQLTSGLSAVSQRGSGAHVCTLGAKTPFYLSHHRRGPSGSRMQKTSMDFGQPKRKDLKILTSEITSAMAWPGHLTMSSQTASTSLEL